MRGEGVRKATMMASMLEKKQENNATMQRSQKAKEQHSNKEYTRKNVNECV